MEAATPLHPTHVRSIGDRLVIDGLVVEDECAARLVREREESGQDAAALVADAVEIGARVLDREQAGANAEFVRTEFEKVSREVESAFAERAQTVTETFSSKLDEVFGADSGHLTRALERHFSDDSSAAVQHRVKEVVAEVMTRSRDDLRRQFSADDPSNPVAGFQKASLAVIKQASDQQDTNLRALLGKLADLEKEVQGLRDERQKIEELTEERERGTAKGRTFEEEVYEAVDVIARAQGDDCDAVGDLLGARGKTGDVLVGIEACRGPARGSVVFEAKTGKLSKPKALAELDAALAERGADFAVLVVPSEEKVPAKLSPLREYNGDKLIATYDPEDGSRLSLEVAYSLARARVLMKRGDVEGVDTDAVLEAVERALGAMDDVRRVKLQLSGATGSIESAREILEAMAGRVRDLLGQIEALTAAAGASGDD